MSRHKSLEQYEGEAKKVRGCLLHKSVSARLIYMLRHGSVSPHLFVCHTCDNGRCILDAHHFLGTPKQNTADSIAKGRFAGKAWRAAVSKRVKQQHKAGKFGQATWSDETKHTVATKVAAALRGKPSGMLGKKMSKAQRARYKAAAIKRSQDPAYIAKLSGTNHWNYGKPSPMRGRKWSAESKLRFSKLRKKIEADKRRIRNCT